MDIYKDMLAKAKIYKKQIINDFVKRGYFPTDKDISAKLESIETRTALCEAYLSKPGSLFNTKEFNYMFEMIYKDLTLLYEILQDILLNEYNQLKVYIEASSLYILKLSMLFLFAFFIPSITASFTNSTEIISLAFLLAINPIVPIPE